MLEVATTSLARSGYFKNQRAVEPDRRRDSAPPRLGDLYRLVHPYGSAQSLLTKPLVPPAGSAIALEEYVAYLATASFISADGRTVSWETGLRAGSAGSNAAINEVPGIRGAVADAARDAGAEASGVAGEAPALYDVSHISEGDVGQIVPLAILAIALVLALVLRSLVAPLYLIVSVVLSFLASLGVSVIVFMDIPHQSGLVFLLPFLMFIFLLALGEDYNILVMTRIREEAAQATCARPSCGSRRDRPDGDLGRDRPRRDLPRARRGRGRGQGNGQIRVIGSAWPSGSSSTRSSCARCWYPRRSNSSGDGTGGPRR